MTFGWEYDKESWGLDLLYVSSDLQRPHWLLLLLVLFCQEYYEDSRGRDLLFVSHVT